MPRRDDSYPRLVNRDEEEEEGEWVASFCGCLADPPSSSDRDGLSLHLLVQKKAENPLQPSGSTLPRFSDPLLVLSMRNLSRAARVERQGNILLWFRGRVQNQRHSSSSADHAMKPLCHWDRCCSWLEPSSLFKMEKWQGVLRQGYESSGE
ncbi:hypothetical protein R1flu_024988 [Riccia fluitans]|uniref:Uncharacterized protein n=1 Tax=Riccia fluitans TaxID=41844 RepID=A0ABD1XWH7_9MARC